MTNPENTADLDPRDLDPSDLDTRNLDTRNLDTAPRPADRGAPDPGTPDHGTPDHGSDVPTPAQRPADVRPAAVRAADLRASDADRERVATRIRDAATEGMLTMPEADERLAAAYAAVTRGELTPLTADLPAPPPPPAATRSGELTRGARIGLAVHAVLVVVFATRALVGWAFSAVPFFWPVFPWTFLALTLVVHYLVARRISRSVAAPA